MYIVGYQLPFQYNELFYVPYMAVAEISLRIRPLAILESCSDVSLNSKRLKVSESLDFLARLVILGKTDYF